MAERHPFSDISWQVSEPEYRADIALSYSTLKKYESEGKFRAIPLLAESISTPSLIFGSLVDALVTGGYGEFENLFLVADLPDISENLQNIARVLHERFGDMQFDEIPDNALAQIGKECDFYASDKYASYRTKLIRENCREYFNILTSATGKTLVSQKDYDDAVRCQEALIESPYTGHFFKTSDDVENYYQLKFKGEDPETHVPYRCMADIIRVDHSAKTVLPIDLKTSSKPEEEFPKSYLQYMYNLQSRNYYRRIKAAMLQDDYYKDFKLLDYTFLVVNRATLSPLPWQDNKTQVSGTVEYNTPSGRKIAIRDPYEIGKEVWYYLYNQSQYPMGVGHENSITKYIETTY